MQPNRPSSVSQDATLVLPTVQSPYLYLQGIGAPTHVVQSAAPADVQAATIAKIAAVNEMMNANSNLHFHNALNDYNTNAAIYSGLGMPVPPPPFPPALYKIKVTWADMQGDVKGVQPTAPGPGLNAWVETETTFATESANQAPKPPAAPAA